MRYTLCTIGNATTAEKYLRKSTFSNCTELSPFSLFEIVRKREFTTYDRPIITGIMTCAKFIPYANFSGYCILSRAKLRNVQFFQYFRNLFVTKDPGDLNRFALVTADTD